jgi:hypothetical protein
MRAVFYPSHCSLRNLVWTAQKRTRLVAKVSASARTSVTFVMRACGITAPPTSAFLDLLVVLVIAGCGSLHRSNQDRLA